MLAPRPKCTSQIAVLISPSWAVATPGRGAQRSATRSIHHASIGMRYNDEILLWQLQLARCLVKCEVVASLTQRQLFYISNKTKVQLWFPSSRPMV